MITASILSTLNPFILPAAGCLAHTGTEIEARCRTAARREHQIARGKAKPQVAADFPFEV